MAYANKYKYLVEKDSPYTKIGVDKMARPRKRRRVCTLPETDRYGPLGIENKNEDIVLMSVDEYEAIRLIDLEGFTQEECGIQMNIARSTVQGIYMEARQKLADSLVNGKILSIEGGDYKLCDGTGYGHGRGCGPGCRRGQGQGRNRRNRGQE